MKDPITKAARQALRDAVCAVATPFAVADLAEGVTMGTVKSRNFKERERILAILDGWPVAEASPDGAAETEASLVEVCERLRIGTTAFKSEACTLFTCLMQMHGLWRGKP